jgi:hypothetical protein
MQGIDDELTIFCEYLGKYVGEYLSEYLAGTVRLVLRSFV